MSKRILVTRALPAALAATAFALASATAGAEESGNQEVQIAAGKLVTVKEGRLGAQTEEYRLSNKVKVGDLDLTTRSGKAELENRIRDAAASVCDQLMDVGPPTSALNQFADHRNCVNGAVHGAMAQARELIALTEQAKRPG